MFHFVFLVAEISPYFVKNCRIFLLGSNMHVAKNVKDAKTFLLSYLVYTRLIDDCHFKHNITKMKKKTTGKS